MIGLLLQSWFNYGAIVLTRKLCYIFIHIHICILIHRAYAFHSMDFFLWKASGFSKTCSWVGLSLCFLFGQGQILPNRCDTTTFIQVVFYLCSGPTTSGPKGQYDCVYLAQLWKNFALFCVSGLFVICETFVKLWHHLLFVKNWDLWKNVVKQMVIRENLYKLWNKRDCEMGQCIT